MFSNPAINVYSQDVMRLVEFYEGLGFRETFPTPEEGTPIHVLLRREGWAINEKRTRRVYSEIGMQLRNKTPKRRVKAALRADRTPPSRSNEVWAMDFVHDQLATGGKFRILTVIDTYSRCARVVDPRSGYRGSDVVATLGRVCKEAGHQRVIRVDQGSEFVSRDLDLWAYQNNVTLDFSRPGKP